MSLRFEDESGDARGNIVFLLYKEKFLNILEIKKGSIRGGHYHEHEKKHILILGKIEYREEDIETGKEQVKIITGPAMISSPAKAAHLFTALEDSIFAEVFTTKNESINYPKYRKIVEEKIKELDDAQKDQ